MPMFPLSSAIRDIRGAVERKLRIFGVVPKGIATTQPALVQALEQGIEELNVLWEQVQEQSEHLARQRQHYADLFQFAPYAYVVTDLYGNIIEANMAALELLHAPIVDLAGKPLAASVAMQHRREFRNNLVEMKLSGGERKAWRGQLRRGRGPVLEVEFNVGAIRQPHDAMLCLCWLLRPVDPGVSPR